MNSVLNATFLDGTVGWQGTSLTVDESNLGGPGRAVLVGTGTTINSNYANGLDVIAGDLLEVLCMAKVGSTVKLQIDTGEEHTITLKRVGDGPTSRGIPSTMSEFRSRIRAGSDGKARIQVSSSASPHLSKPYIEKVAGNARPRFWTPGPHSTSDLNMKVWPSNFPPFQQDSVQVEPTPVRKGFAGDIPIPATSRMSMTPAYRFQGELELSAMEYDQLEELCYGAVSDEPFWFVRPDTKQVCQAFWMEDGSPRTMGAHNIVRRVGLSLLLQVV